MENVGLIVVLKSKDMEVEPLTYCTGTAGPYSAEIPTDAAPVRATATALPTELGQPVAEAFSLLNQDTIPSVGGAGPDVAGPTVTPSLAWRYDDVTASSKVVRVRLQVITSMMAKSLDVFPPPVRVFVLTVNGHVVLKAGVPTVMDCPLYRRVGLPGEKQKMFQFVLKLPAGGLLAGNCKGMTAPVR